MPKLKVQTQAAQTDETTTDPNPLEGLFPIILQRLDNLESAMRRMDAQRNFDHSAGLRNRMESLEAEMASWRNTPDADEEEEQLVASGQCPPKRPQENEFDEEIMRDLERELDLGRQDIIQQPSTDRDFGQDLRQEVVVKVPATFGEKSDHGFATNGANGGERVGDTGRSEALEYQPPGLAPLQAQSAAATGIRHEVTTEERGVLYGREDEAPRGFDDVFTFFEKSRSGGFGGGVQRDQGNQLSGSMV